MSSPRPTVGDEARPDTAPGQTIAAKCVDLVKQYGTGPAAVRALDGVSVAFPRGAFTAVMGPSGSGKSTLMHCMAALDAPTSGTVIIGDTDVTAMKDRELTMLRRERIGFVFQSFNLLPTLSAAENVILPQRLGGRRPDQSWLDTVIRTLGIGDRLSHRPAELSGGQQQRVAVGRALAGKPEIVFADEPTGNLDSTASADLLGFMRRSVDEFGQTIVMVTHDPVAAGYADGIVFLADGRVVDHMEAPTAERVLDHMKKFGG
jgi:putative ABC transport system ATP-binding protein